MAQKLLGIDLGAYSVKVVVATAGLRSTSLTDFIELPLPAPVVAGPDGESLEARAAFAIGEMMRQRGFEHDIPYVALGGDALSMRVLDFQFAGLKRSDLDKAVGAELEAQLPHELDEMLYDFEIIPRLAHVDPEATAAGGAAPAVKKVSTGTRVLAAASTRERVGKVLASCAQVGVDPRALIAAPAAYAKMAARLGLGVDDPIAVIDHGHTRTNVCVLSNGKTIYARTISRGGKHVTQAIARAWSLPYDDAERAKHSDGFVASAREPATSEAWGRISEVIKQDLVPLVRDLRQTLAACRAQTGVSAERALLCGGGGRLRGLCSYLGEELAVPMSTIPPDDAARLIGLAAATRGLPADGAALACGIALEAASGRPQYDLRKGPFAYRADFGFLRAKAGYLAGVALVVVAFAAGNAYAALYGLHKEEGILADRLKTTSTEILGAPATVDEVEEKIAPKKEENPLPKSTAFDQLVDISKKLPPRPDLKIDVEELDVRKDKVTIKATTDSRAAIDDIEKGIKQIDCFTDVQRGKIVEDTATKDVDFSLTITSKCM